MCGGPGAWGLGDQEALGGAACWGGDSTGTSRGRSLSSSPLDLCGRASCRTSQHGPALSFRPGLSVDLEQGDDLIPTQRVLRGLFHLRDLGLLRCKEFPQSS